MPPTVFRLASALDEFRAMEMNEDAIPVLGDDDAMRVLAAWSKTEQDWKKPRRSMPRGIASTAKRWEWICEGWTIDEDAVARGSGLLARVVREKLDMLRMNRLIYPDGTMARGAKVALGVFVTSKVGSKKQPKAPKEPKAPSETN